MRGRRLGKGGDKGTKALDSLVTAAILDGELPCQPCFGPD